MKLRMYYVIAVVCVMCTYAQNKEVPPPLPAANVQLVEHYRLALEAVFGMGIRLQAFLEDEDNENFLVSPISATVIIGQLILGAEGKFRKQLVELLSLPNSHLYESDIMQYYNKKKNVTFSLPYSTLHLQLSTLLKALESGSDVSKHFLLTEKSALFLDEKISLNGTFRKTIQGVYDTGIYPLNFRDSPASAQKHVNDWATVNTHGLIKSILAAPPSPTTAAIFANAIYFKGEWEMPFSDMLNRNGPFNVSATKMISVTYMINQLDQILYSESKDYRIIALPYRNEELGMYIILPKSDNVFKYNMKSFVRNISSLDILETIKKAKRRDVLVKIPKMSISHSFSIIDQLRKYRIFKQQHIKVNSTNVVNKLEAKVNAFSNFTTDEYRDIVLTGAAVGVPLRVDDIVQQVSISINEKGTEAAAVSAGTINYMGGSKNFIIERPFVFFIRHEATGAALFWGTVSNPAA